MIKDTVAMRHQLSRPIGDHELEIICGGSRRRSSESSDGHRRRGPGGRSGDITNLFVQINIAMIFVFGGENITIFNWQENASDGDLFFKLV